jgi:O-acetyl-ADP-ribose deacetylase (regulator of RNase III)
MIELTTGNLLDARTEALVNTVNIEGVMGKGIALQFSKKFPDMYAAYRKVCKDGKLKPGEMHVFERSEMFGPKFIINFPTKRSWRSRSRLDDIESGLKALANAIERLKIKSIAVPPLGCGFGGLSWGDVLPLMQKELGPLRNVQILIFQPKGAPAAGEMPRHPDRPELNPKRALVLKVLHQYLALGYQLTLLEVQKLLYFLQEAGEDLRLRFAKQTYGPYADNLRFVLHRFEGHYTLGFADGRNKPETEIELLAGAAGAADAVLVSSDNTYCDSLQRLARVAKLIEGFESPYGMELLATVHWLARHENAKTFPDVVSGVQAWNQRKSRVMKKAHIEVAYQRLKEQDWIGS